MITTNFEAKLTKFPNGEVKYNLDFTKLLTSRCKVRIKWEYESDGEFFQLALLSDVLKELKVEFDLVIPYLPYSRQDRPSIMGESFSLKTACNFINSFEATNVFVFDPHSDVTRALIKNIVITEQHDIHALNVLKSLEQYFYLISPDAGALKKTYKLASVLSNVLEVVECSKKRDTSTGDITDTIVHFDDFVGRDCVIVDDICEAGRTFIEIAKILKEKGAGKITLFVTHGFFSKGLGVFDNLIDEIYTHKGRVK